MAGTSTRVYVETLQHGAVDLLPAAEQLAEADPSLREFNDLAARRPEARHETGRHASDRFLVSPQLDVPGVLGHGASPLMWALLVSPERADPPGRRRRLWAAPFEREYDRTTLLKRFPLKQVLVHRRYQTHFNFRDYLPFSGIQTWALGDEPPIIHPTPLAPSTTQGDRLDTARQGASHNWGLYGAGAVGIDGYFRPAQSADEVSLLVARYDWLWRVVFFTDLSTVMLEFGRGGPRRTLWTLNRLEPAAPSIAPGVVSFAGRRGCIHSTVAAPPTVVNLAGDHKWATGVRQLRYDCGEGPAAFALSDGSFRFLPGDVPAGGKFRFSDAAGTYEAVLHEAFRLEDNPGNFNIDVWHMARDSVARRLA